MCKDWIFLVQHNQYHGCWCPGSLCRQNILSRGRWVNVLIMNAMIFHHHHVKTKQWNLVSIHNVNDTMEWYILFSYKTHTYFSQCQIIFAQLSVIIFNMWPWSCQNMMPWSLVLNMKNPAPWIMKGNHIWSSHANMLPICCREDLNNLFLARSWVLIKRKRILLSCIP